MVTRTYNTVTKALNITTTAGGASANLLYTCPSKTKSPSKKWVKGS
jgi:hypothetical protein